jgi:preprotein translocase subunit SecD
MKTYFAFLSAIIFLACSDNESQMKFLSFELRLAEPEADSGFVTMNLENSNMKFYVGKYVYLQNKDIISAKVIDEDTHPKVFVTLTDEGGSKFADFTEQNIGKNAAILVDGKLVSAPRINAKIVEGKLIIVGYFTYEEAEKIAQGIYTNKK